MDAITPSHTPPVFPTPFSYPDFPKRTVRADKIIDGKKVAEDIHAECLAETKKMLAETGKAPGLAVILVGERKDSQTYVRSKKRMCVKDGITPFDYTFPEDISEVPSLHAI